MSCQKSSIEFREMRLWPESNEEEIEKMRKDAELHAEEDKQKQRLAEVRNRSEALCFQTEKLIKENDEKLSDADKAPLEAAIAKAREAAKGEDADAVQSAHDALEQASHALSKVLYESQAADAAGGETAGSEPAGAAVSRGTFPALYPASPGTVRSAPLRSSSSKTKSTR